MNFKKLLILVFIPLSLFLFLNKENVNLNPFASKYYIENATKVFVNDFDEGFVINNTFSEVLKIRNRKITNIITDQFSNAWDVVTDKDRNIFVLEYNLDHTGIFIDYERVLKYSPRGNFIEEYFIHEYDEDNRPELEPNKRRIFYQEDNIYIFMVCENYITFYKINNEKEREDIVRIKSENPKLHILDGYLNIRNGIFVYLNKTGEVFQGNLDDDFYSISYFIDENYKNSKVIPWEVMIDRGKIFISDVGTNRIIEIGESNYFKTTDVLTSFFTKGNLFFATSYNKVFTGTKFETEESNYLYLSSLLIIKKIFFGLVFYFNVLIGLVLLYELFKVLKKTDGIKNLIISLSFIIIVSLVFVQVNRNSSIFIEEVISNQLKFLNQIISNNIDGDLVHLLDSRDDFMNENYQELRTQLREVLNNNQDPWNEEFYSAIYIIEDGDVKVLMFYDDSSGLFFPYLSNYEETVFYFNEDDDPIRMVQESDVYGNWLYSLGPIYDSKGEVVAYLEVGIDFTAFENKIMELNNKTVRFSVIIITIIIMEYMFLQFFFLYKKRKIDKK